MTTKSALVGGHGRPDSRSTTVFKRHDDLAEVLAAGGARDRMPVSVVLDLLPSLPTWPARHSFGKRARGDGGARAILRWLSTHPGEGWQDRWVVSGADTGLTWVDSLVAAEDPREHRTQRDELMAGLASLLLCRIVFPSYQFLADYMAHALYSHTRTVFCPDLFALLETRGRERRANSNQVRQALNAVSKIVLHTGHDVDQLTTEDLLAYRAWHQRRHDKAPAGLSLAWTLLHGIAQLGEHPTLKEAVRHGQRPTAELVDAYRITSPSVREVLIRYLDERRPSLDYSSFRHLAGNLAGRFWSDIQHHHPDLNTLQLPEPVAEAWKQRLHVVSIQGGGTRPRRDVLAVMICVRAFYRDLQEWAMQDPSWARWSYPNPVRKRDTAGQRKAKQKTTAAMHQRIRERLPHLPLLIETAERHRVERAALLAAVKSTAIGATVEHSGRSYRRVVPHAYTETYYRDQAPPDQVEDLITGEILDVGREEHEAFWAWAVIETLRHTGVRIEELLEITHLGLVSYRLPDTGEIVPMLQVVPSKSNEERLLLVSPELASVLATVITRLRDANNGTVPLSARYDSHERVTGPTLPHLFQHRLGWAWEVPSPNTIQRWLTQTLARTGLTDTVSQPLRYTPHDFRRMFATEAVSGGLPVHIAARVLGHKNINTSQSYIAVFDEHLVRSYRTFLDNRRALRPEAEYREPTDQEWNEFHQHFQIRKLELGECGRPYGSPCKHEHACIRCPSLRVDPRARTRIIEITHNLRDRIAEARANGWTGEVEGLRTSLHAAAAKLASLDRMRNLDESDQRRVIDLGFPLIQTTSRC